MKIVSKYTVLRLSALIIIIAMFLSYHIGGKFKCDTITNSFMQATYRDGLAFLFTGIVEDKYSIAFFVGPEGRFRIYANLIEKDKACIIAEGSELFFPIVISTEKGQPI